MSVRDSIYTDPDKLRFKYLQPFDPAREANELAEDSMTQTAVNNAIITGGINSSTPGIVGSGGSGGGGGIGGCPRLDQFILVNENGLVVARKVESLIFDPQRIYNPLTNKFQPIKEKTVLRSPIWNMKAGNAETFTSNTHLAIRGLTDHTGLRITKFNKSQDACLYDLNDQKPFVGATNRIEDTETLANVLKIELAFGHIYAVSNDGVNFILAHNAKPRDDTIS